jgi:hypothetical protein
MPFYMRQSSRLVPIFENGSLKNAYLLWVLSLREGQSLWSLSAESETPLAFKSLAGLGTCDRSPHSQIASAKRIPLFYDSLFRPLPSPRGHFPHRSDGSERMLLFPYPYLSYPYLYWVVKWLSVGCRLVVNRLTVGCQMVVNWLSVG